MSRGKTTLRALCAILALGWVMPAAAQSSPGWVLHYVPSVTEWNGWFAAKQDVNGDATGQHVTANGTTAARTLGARFGAELNPLDFGAQCNGTTDDTASLTAWAAAVTANSVATIPNSACKFTSPIAFPQVNFVTLKGAGKQSQLLYAGSATTGEIVTIGSTSGASNGCSAKGWTIHNLRVMSNTVMTAGDGLLLGHLCESDIENIEVGGDLDGNQNWFNAVHFYGGNTIHMRGYSFSGSGDAELVHGDSTFQLVDLYQSGGGKLVHGATGLHIAGNTGGLTVDQTDILANNTNVLVDQSAVAIPNVQLFFEAGVAIDGTNSGAGLGASFTVADAGSSNSLLFFSGTWIASALPGASGPGGACVWFEAGVQWRVEMAGGTIFNCRTDGLRNDSTATTINIAGTYIAQNSGFGVNNTAGVNNVVTQGVLFGTNRSGNYSVNVQANGYKQYGLFGADASNPMYAANWFMAAAQSQNSATIAGIANGTVGPAATAEWHFVGGTPNSNATWTLADNNGVPTYSLSLGSGVVNFTLPTLSSVTSTGKILSNGGQGFESAGTTPDYQWYVSTGATDQKYWDILDDPSGNLIIRSLNDGFTASTPWVTFNRGSGYSLGTIKFQAPPVLPSFTVATLPASPLSGEEAYVTDAASPTWNGTLTGGGSIKVLAVYNGTAWTAH